MNQLRKFGGDALKPLLVNGSWRKPKISARQAAGLRKQAVVDGTYGSFCPERGGWDPAWDKQYRAQYVRSPKGHKRERTRAERIAKIDKRMEEMPAKLKAHRADAEALKPAKTRENFLKSTAFRK